MLNRAIPGAIISNIALVTGNGLQYGQLGNLIALFASPVSNDPMLCGVMRKHLIDIISCDTLDGSYSTGILGVMTGVLLLKINNLIDIDFDEIFERQHAKLSCFVENSTLDSYYKKLHYLEYLAYERLLCKGQSALYNSFDKDSSRSVFELATIGENSDEYELCFGAHLIRRYILLYKLGMSSLSSSMISNMICFYFEQLKRRAYLSYDSDFLTDCLKYAIDYRQNDILKVVIERIDDYMKNLNFNLMEFRDYVTSHNLLRTFMEKVDTTPLFMMLLKK